MVMNSHREQVSPDDPPYSRLFVVYNKNDPMSETEIRQDFSAFGRVVDVFILKDKKSGDQKGVAYVKFSKMSEAAYAMEELNNSPISNHSGTYKIYIARSRGEARSSDDSENDRYLRLFVNVPKTATESDIKLHFSKFGDVQSVKLLRYKDTNESKGCGFVTYSKISEAAKAVEDVDNEHGFKAVIARPKEKDNNSSTNFNSNFNSSFVEHSPVSSGGARSANYDLHSSTDYFQASVSSKLTKEQITRLFDIAPGLRDIQLVPHDSHRSDVIATYNSTLAAEYALNKLHGIEYPLGEFINVESKPFNRSTSAIPVKRDYRGEQIDYSDTNREVNQKLSALSKALTDATALLKFAGLSSNLPSSLSSESHGFDSPTWLDDSALTSSNVTRPSSKYFLGQLPPPQKILHKSVFSEATGMRLFFVGHPSAPPMEALLDVYCRFGNFAGATILQRKNYGYLYYTSAESALKAIEVTDERPIAGMRMKILKADPKNEPSHKRKKIDHAQ